MNKEKIEDIGSDIAGHVRDEVNEAGTLAENVSSASKSFLESQLDTYTDLTNIAIDGTEKIVDLNVAAGKDLLSTVGNASNEKMESAANAAVDAAETNLAKATDQVK